ncbi:transcription termination/antitermination protein NusG, partial [Mycolicibacterium elephantis]
MTSFEGDTPSAEAVDLVDDGATEATKDDVADDAVTDEAPAADAAEAPADAPAEQPAEEEEEEDPAVALKRELRSKPGEWYVIHSYAGYENKVKANLETRVQNLD